MIETFNHRLTVSRRYPPAAPLIEQPETPPSTPSSENPNLKAVPVQDWSKLPPESAYFLSVNRGKRSLGVNLKTEEGQDLVRELVKNADVLVRSFLLPSILD